MQERTYTVTGSNLSELAAALEAKLEPKATHDGDGFTVLMCEEFEFWRTNSNMQATVILDHQDDDTATVNVTVGGGGAGLLQWTFGSEKKVGRKFWRGVVRVFDDLGLRWTKETDSTES
jgi:hypothetical protein